MATFVLVHGTGFGGWCWQGASRVLRGAGHDVCAPTLSGLADRSHLLECGIDLETHVTDIANLLFYEDLTDVVLVGHSYARMVITGVAAAVPERLGLLVYLDAYIPEEGRRMVDLWPPEMLQSVEAEAAASGGLRPAPSAELLGITDPAVAERSALRSTSQPMAIYARRATRE